MTNNKLRGLRNAAGFSMLFSWLLCLGLFSQLKKGTAQNEQHLSTTEKTKVGNENPRFYVWNDKGFRLNP
jgi:hypothetical protein